MAEKTASKTGVLRGHKGPVTCVSLSGDGLRALSGSTDHTVRVWDVSGQKCVGVLEGHTKTVWGVAMSGDGRRAVSGCYDHTVRVWDVSGQKCVGVLEGHTGEVTCVSLSVDGLRGLSGSSDKTVRVWDVSGQKCVGVLEGHTGRVWCVSLSVDGLRGLSGSDDNTVRVWEIGGEGGPGGGGYRNAKVVLLGERSVGKTCLARALMGEKFEPQESTHGRHVWTLESGRVAVKGGGEETRETLLWDLAGQPGYRLIHQLHLNEVAVALVVFDVYSETDPFAGVHYWARALRQALKVQGKGALPLRKVLVGTKVDQQAMGVSEERIGAVLTELKFDGWFATSAKEGRKIGELLEAIRKGIDWEAQPWVISTEMFEKIKGFLVEEKKAGRLLATGEDLFRGLVRGGGVGEATKRRSDEATKGGDELRAQFETCVGLVESRGLVQRLSFGGLVLLQPELLDAYAGGMTNAAKEEPDGMGFIAEEVAQAGKFGLSESERIKDAGQEKLLLLATVEELLKNEIALREQTEEGMSLVFPSQFTREWPEAPDPKGKAVIYTFEGAVLNVYTTLAVRLARSGMCGKREMWKNTVVFEMRFGGKCGMWLRELEEGKADLTLFYDKGASEQTKYQFEEYVRTHLERKAVAGSVKRRRIVVCGGCGTAVSDEAAMKRRERGFDWIRCNVCDEEISLREVEEKLKAEAAARVGEVDRAAEAGKEKDVATAVIKGKMATGDYDVFLAYNSEDLAEVRAIGEKLKERGVLPWFDVVDLRPGTLFQNEIGGVLEKVKSVAVFVGKSGVGPWERLEIGVAISQFAKRVPAPPVIPVLLAGAEKEPKLPLFLKEFNWVRFEKGVGDDEALERLVWGITGKRGERGEMM